MKLLWLYKVVLSRPGGEVMTIQISTAKNISFFAGRVIDVHGGFSSLAANVFHDDCSKPMDIVHNRTNL